MKKNLLSAALGVTALLAGASINGYKSVVFHNTDGSSFAVAMEDGMTTRVAGGNVTLSCAKGDVVVPCDRLKFWNYSASDGDSGLWQGLELVGSDMVGVVLESDRISLHNLPQDSMVGLYSVDGRMIVNARVSEYYEIPTSSLTRGVYVLTYNGKSLKVAVK